MAGPADVPELAVSLAWHRGQVPEELATPDGGAVRVIHRGTWSHGFGPDFADAMVLFDGRDLRTGAVEIHLDERDWTAHGHHRDPRYAGVILHVVARAADVRSRTVEGAEVPVAVLDAATVASLPTVGIGAGAWDRFGGASCAPDLAASRPQAVREALWTLGDRRLAGRAARFEAELSGRPAADVLWSALLDGLGYSANRDPMRAVAEALPVAALDAALSARPETARGAAALALLMGVAGFLPLAPVDAAFAGLGPDAARGVEAEWARLGGPWAGQALPPTAWTRARVRPANHPAARLAAAASLAVAAHARGGQLPALMDGLRDGQDPVRLLVGLASADGVPPLGHDRAAEMVSSALLPLALAFAESVGDLALAEAASRAWEALPAPAANAVTRRAMRQVAGDRTLSKLGGRGAQGLIHLDATLCAPRRCYECPVAHRVLAAEAAQTS